MYKNYIFDLYGTLIDIRTDEWSEEPWEEFAAWLTGNGMPYTGSEVKALYDNEVNRLKKAGKKVYLLSNAQRVFTWQELVKTGIVDDFDDIFISSDEGCKKPDPEFYKKLINKHNLDITECIMIGNDSTSDIAGAKAVGMDALYVRTAISPENDPVPDCRYVFEDGDIGHVLDI